MPRKNRTQINTGGTGAWSSIFLRADDGAAGGGEGTSLMGGSDGGAADGDKSLLGGAADGATGGEGGDGTGGEAGATGTEGDGEGTQTPEQKAAADQLAAATTPEEKAAAEAAVEAAMTPEQKAAAKAAKDAEGAPEAYEPFKMPENMQMDEGMLEEFGPVAKELDLSQDKAQKLVDLYAEKVQKVEQAQQDELAQQRKDWVDEVKKDPKYEENLGFAKKAVNKFAVGKAEGAKELLTGGNWLGDHPALIGFLANVGKVISEDTFVEGGAGNSTKSTAQILYPDQK